MFPPCKSQLHQHLLRTSYIAHLWSNAHLPILSELLPTEYGWEEIDDKYVFKWFEGDQLPPSVTSISIIDENPQGIYKFIISKLSPKTVDRYDFVNQLIFLYSC